MDKFHTELRDWRILPDDVDFSQDGWTFGRGGRNLQDDQWSIGHVSENLKETLYVLPDCFSEMLNKVREWGRKEAQEAMRAALGL